MRVDALGQVLLAASTAIPSPGSSCLTAERATRLSNVFAFLVSQWNTDPAYAEQLCNHTLTPDFVDYSDSIRIIESAGCNPGPQPLDQNRYEFILDQATLQPFNFEVGKVWHSCDTVTFRWVSRQSPHNVTGIVVLETVLDEQAGAATTTEIPSERRIAAAYSEFNTVTWLANLHKLVLDCKARGEAPNF